MLCIPNKNTIVNKALHLAVSAHGDQVRGGNINLPYVFHPIDVANEIIYYSGLRGNKLQKAIIIAILHDVLEDTIVKYEYIVSEFGTELADGVQFLTKDESVPKPHQFTENLNRLIRAPIYVQAVKLGDRTSNLKIFPLRWSRTQISHYLDDSVILSNALGSAPDPRYARLIGRREEQRME